MYIWYRSLLETTLALNNSLYQLQSAMAYIFSVVFLGELLTIKKSMATIIVLGGVFLISYGSINDGVKDNTIQGVILCIVTAIGFGSYKVVIKIMQERHNDKVYPLRDILYFMGYCGIWVLVLGPFVLWALHELKVEHFDLPPDLESISIMLKVWVADLLFNFFLVAAVTYTSPYQVGIGLVLVIPASYFTDAFRGKLDTEPGWMEISGVVLIATGYLTLKLKIPKKSSPVRAYRKVKKAMGNVVCALCSEGEG